MKKPLLVASTLLFAPLAFSATIYGPSNYHDNGFSWTHVDAAVTSHDYDSRGSNMTRYSADVSYAVGPHIYILGGASYGSLDDTNNYSLHAGAGYHWSLIDDLDLFADAQVLWAHTEASYTSVGWYPTGTYPNVAFGPHTVDVDDSEIGYLVRAGARYRIASRLEAKGGIFRQDAANGNTGAFASIRYDFTRSWGVGARASFADYDNTLGLFVRYRF